MLGQNDSPGAPLMKYRVPVALIALWPVFLFASPAAAQEDASERGDAAYEMGDYEEAFKWYSQAAEQGNLAAQLNIGIMYDDGIGVAENDAEAAKWFRLAAEQGDEQAQHNLGVMYEEGEGVAPSHSEAVKWYRMAAEQGYAPSQLNLGVMYAQGTGVSKNYVEAHKWLSLSAAQGNDLAAANKEIVGSWRSPSQIEKSEKLLLEWKPAAER